MIDRETAAETVEALERRLVENLEVNSKVTRRGVLGGIGLAGGAALSGVASTHTGHDDKEHGNFGAVDEYDGGFDPHEFLTAFNTGQGEQSHVTQDVFEEDGQTVRYFEIDAVDASAEVAPDVHFTTWAYNGQVPGPTLRAVEGDLIRVRFRNLGSHAHTIHPHLKNLRPEMDGIPQNGPGVIETNGEYVYEWQAEPPGVHLYHCHSLPLKEHIHRGLYGTIVVDPDPSRVKQNPRRYVNYHGPITQDYRRRLVERAESLNHTHPRNDEVNEMVIVMNSFDTNFDGDNEIYAANTRAFAYGVAKTDGKGEWEGSGTKHPIEVEGDVPQRVYLVNTTEFDPINSFHTHSQFFDYYDHGTTLMPTKKRVDTVMQCQAQRGIVEIDYSDHEQGLYMFHAHQSEFAELGWMSFFEVK